MEKRPRLSRDEITIKLQQMISDPATSPENRAQAHDRLERYERLSSGGGSNQPRVSALASFARQIEGGTMQILTVLTFIGAGIGTLFLLLALFGSSGAPQQATGAAMAVAFVVIPYCVLSAVQRNALLRRKD